MAEAPASGAKSSRFRKVKTNRKTGSESQRKQDLACFGEDRAFQLLSKKKGFDVEKMPKNFPFFDLMAKQGDRSLLVPVKTRSKHTAKGTIKTDSYNLYTKPGHFESAMKIARFFGAQIAWVAVTVDTKTKTYSAYTGEVSNLPSPRYIPMHPTLDVPKHDCLANDVPDGTISESWSNRVETSD
jgi:hypothetical protein